MSDLGPLSNFLRRPARESNRPASRPDSDARPTTIAWRKSFSAPERTPPAKQNTFAEETSRTPKFRMFLEACELLDYASVKQSDSTAQQLTHNSQPVLQFKVAALGPDRFGLAGS